jgi:hypothetical protein
MEQAAGKRSTAVRKRSEHIPAQPSVDAQFLALLRRKCVRAASVGALTAAAEAIPGLSQAFGLVFGELIDAQFLAAVQRELVEETFALYGFKLPSRLHSVVVNKVQVFGAGAGIAGDALMRRTLQRGLGKLGSFVARRVAPVASIVSSAFSNALVTYAIGKRAQALARLRGSPLKAMPDVMRAFSGVDERRVYAWTMEAVNEALGKIGSSIRRVRFPRMPWKRDKVEPKVKPQRRKKPAKD